VVTHHHSGDAHDAHLPLLSAGALQGVSYALLGTAVVGGVALALELVWPWLAWGYVLGALLLGTGVALASARLRRVHEREVARVRRLRDDGLI
jgi:hypothetical protein